VLRVKGRYDPHVRMFGELSMRRIIRVAVIAALVAVPALVAGTGSAAVGTWTKITSPKGPGKPIYQLFNENTTSPKMNVSGVTSNDVTAVNFFCFSNADHNTSDSPLNAAPVPVSSGEFNATAVPTPNSSTPCVLRAVPSTYTGISGTGTNTGYVGAFAGPSFYFGVREAEFSTGSKIAVYILEAVQQRSVGVFASPDEAGVDLQEPVDDFTKILSGVAASMPDLAIVSGNLVASGSSTHSEIVIDGRSAYFPASLDGIAVNLASVPGITLSAHRSSNGSLSIAETDPLRSCAGNAFPQSSGTCTPVATGVELKRTIVTSVQGAVVTVHDRFISINHRAHSLKLEYGNGLSGAGFGDPAVRLPGKSSFSVPTPNTTKTNLPAGPNTIYMTSDIHATDNQPDRADLGLTYSAKPTVYFPLKNEFALRYTRHIPAGGSANLSFALESGFSMSSVTAWAKSAQKALIPHLVITSAHGKPTTVKGSVTNPVNGLPTKVTVSSGATHATATVSATGTWKASLHLATGVHKITVKGTDPSGRKLTASVTVHVT
jgi:hypothetical protein